MSNKKLTRVEMINKVQSALDRVSELRKSMNKEIPEQKEMYDFRLGQISALLEVRSMLNGFNDSLDVI